MGAVNLGLRAWLILFPVAKIPFLFLRKDHRNNRESQFSVAARRT